MREGKVDRFSDKDQKNKFNLTWLEFIKLILSYRFASHLQKNNVSVPSRKK